MDFSKRLRYTMRDVRRSVDVCLAPLWHTAPSATNGLIPWKLQAVAPQEAKIIGIMHKLCVFGKDIVE